MQKLFLASMFKEVAHQFAEFAGEPLAGKRMAFIPTASVPLVPIRNSQAILVTGTEKQIVP